MERFIIKDRSYGYKPMRLYYNNIDEAHERFPDAVITIDRDKSFVKSVEKIKAFTEATFCDYRRREVWQIPYSGRFILYRQYVDGDEYLDGCEYQRWDNLIGTTPVGWTVSNPKEFEELFLKEKPSRSDELFVSQKEIKKRKAQKFYNKNNKIYWRDNEGFFYKANKYDLPDKKAKEEYERFKGNQEAVFVWYGTEPAFGKREWFDGMDSFMDFFEEKKQNNPHYLADLHYNVLKKGYKKLAPDERKVIIALPYIDIDKELLLARRATANENGICHIVANVWCNQIGYKNIDWVEDIVKKYMEIKEG